MKLMRVFFAFVLALTIVRMAQPPQMASAALLDDVTDVVDEVVTPGDNDNQDVSLVDVEAVVDVVVNTDGEDNGGSGDVTDVVEEVVETITGDDSNGTDNVTNVAAEVEIDNASDQPLAFTPAEIRMRDANGTDYRGGSALGTEPSINLRNLNGGERSRSWVWFIIPTETTLVEIVYAGPQPQFRITLPESS